MEGVLYYHGKCTAMYDKIQRMQGKYDIFEVSMTGIDKNMTKQRTRLAITTHVGHFKSKHDENELKSFVQSW